MCLEPLKQKEAEDYPDIEYPGRTREPLITAAFRCGHAFHASCLPMSDSCAICHPEARRRRATTTEKPPPPVIANDDVRTL